MTGSNEWLRLGGGARGALEEFCRLRRKTFYPKTDLDAAALPTLRRRKAEVAAASAGVARACAELFGGPPRVVEPLEGAGTLHALFRVVAGDGEPYVFRAGLAGDESRAFEFEAHAFEFIVDGWASETLSRAGAPTAEVCLVDLAREVCPFDFEIAREARGRTLKSFEDEETQATPPRLLSGLGRLAAVVHGVETEGFGLIDVSRIAEDGRARGRGLLKTWREYVMLNLDAHVEACRRIGAVGDEEAARIRDVFDGAADLLEGVPSRLLHGDLGAHNVLTDGERLTAIIDWEDALCGDPVFDIAYWGTFVRDEMRETFLEGYRSARALPADFERRYWLYYLRVALSKTVHRRLFGHADRPGRPAASRRIQKGLERFESSG
jgi:aminoglycoside phosphotransferase (APT) family kinase protein